MKKYNILPYIIIGLICCNSCKTKKTLTFEQKYSNANKLYSKKDFNRALEIYQNLYQDVPNKFENIIILEKIADCKFQEKAYKSCFSDYKRLYKFSNDEKKLTYAYRMCLSLFQTIEKNNKRDINEIETLIELIDSILEEYETNTISPEQTDILKEITEIKIKLEDKIIQKHLNIIKTYEKLEDYKAAIVYSQNFISKYPKSTFLSEVCISLIKNQYKTASKMEIKYNRSQKTKEKKDKLFEAWKQVIIAYDTYKNDINNDKMSKKYYMEALKKIIL